MQNQILIAHLCDIIKKSKQGVIFMDVNGYVKFLEGQRLSPAGIATRKNKLSEAQEYIGKDLDAVVSGDDEMYDALIKLQEIDDPAHAPRQNALRKYYTFKNGKEFPRLNQYK